MPDLFNPKIGDRYRVCFVRALDMVSRIYYIQYEGSFEMDDQNWGRLSLQFRILGNPRSKFMPFAQSLCRSLL